MNTTILTALLCEWIEELSIKISDLDGTLPIEHQISSQFVYIRQPTAAGTFPIIDLSAFTKTPEKNPECYEKVETVLPLIELDPLRDLVLKMERVVLNLQKEPKNKKAKKRKVIA